MYGIKMLFLSTKICNGVYPFDSFEKCFYLGEVKAT